jgi:hypothetical protein
VVLNLFDLKRTPGIVKMTTSVYVRPSGKPMERHIPWMGSDLAGVWPDSGLTVTPPDSEVARWREANDQMTSRMGIVGAEADTTRLPPDAVLDRAVEALRATKRR